MVDKRIIIDPSTNLYRVAAEQYKDSRKMIVLIQDNFLPSPFLKQPIVIDIPDSPPDDQGKPHQDTTPGTGFIQTNITYSYTQTKSIPVDGVTEYTFSNGVMTSKTTGVGLNPYIVPRISILLYEFSTITISNIQQTSVVATWTQADPDDLTLYYILQYRQSGALDWITYEITNLLTSPVTGLLSNTAYEFRVIPANSLGNSLGVAPITTAITSVYPVLVNP